MNLLSNAQRDQVVGGVDDLIQQMLTQYEIEEWERLTGQIHPSNYQTGI